MADAPSWRQGYDSLERQLGPRLEAVVRSEGFAVAVGLLARVQRVVQDEAGRTTRRLLHRLNLPAGTDVSRILNEIGQLRLQVRQLSTELDEAKAALEAQAASASKTRSTTRTASTPRKGGSRRGSDARS